ncbi:hypothetical protein V1605_20100 [Enterobacter soli]|uniref:hypothetical protein n=1 Tax=Enterobacter soli TaxID=885040 RepID=UPI0020B89052
MNPNKYASLRATVARAKRRSYQKLVMRVTLAEEILDQLANAEKRIAELSASHSKLREAMAGIHNTITGGGAYTPLAGILNASKRAYEESAAAAGKGE